MRESLRSEFQRHNRELKKIRKFILGKQQKNPFEQELLDTVRDFLGHGEEALQRLEASGYAKPPSAGTGKRNRLSWRI